MTKLKGWMPFLFVTAALAQAVAANATDVKQPGEVTILRVPNNGIQPQVAVGKKGIVYMIYFQGDPANGDLYYVHSQDGGATFSTPIRVNSESGSAVALGNIRGGHIAVGKNGRVHVAWNGSRTAKPAGPAGEQPMLYTRLNDAGTAFEPQRNVIQFAYGLDGGGALAAGRDGNVYVVWHAPAPGATGEANRRVWIARSTDGGKTFERERPVFDEPTGACGCCGLNAFADQKGNVYVLYRSASEVVNRDMYLLASNDRGQTFHGADISKWKVGYCVMSSESFTSSPNGPLAAWETEKQVYFGPIDATTGKIAPAIAAPGSTGDRKHPALASNNRGETLLAWTQGMGWNKGGSLAWQVFDKDGNPEGATGFLEGVPKWSLVAAFAKPDGTFALLY